MYVCEVCVRVRGCVSCVWEVYVWEVYVHVCECMCEVYVYEVCV